MNSRASFLSSSTFVLPPSRLLPCYACVEGARKAGAAKPEDDGNWTHRLGNAPHFFAAINITHPPPPPISYVTRQFTPPECQEYRPPPERAESNTTTPNPKTKGMGGKYTCVRARACVACLNQTKPKPAFGSAAYKKSSKRPKNSQKFERNKNERYCEWDGKK